MRMLLSWFLVASAASLACDSADVEQTRPTVAVDKTGKDLNPRTQYELLTEIADALRADDDEDPDALGSVRQDYINRGYRWEVALLPILCRTADDCLVMPFDHSQVAANNEQGWLPRLRLTSEEHGKLTDQCRGKNRCVLTFEGRMTQLRLSTEHPTAVSFDHVRILESREAAADESWIRRG